MAKFNPVDGGPDDDNLEGTNGKDIITGGGGSDVLYGLAKRDILDGGLDTSGFDQDSLYGGKGKVTWTLYGVLFYTILATSLQQLKLDNFTIDIVKGAIILAAATLDAVRVRLRKRSTTAPAPEGKEARQHG